MFYDVIPIPMSLSQPPHGHFLDVEAVLAPDAFCLAFPLESARLLSHQLQTPVYVNWRRRKLHYPHNPPITFLVFFFQSFQGPRAVRSLTLLSGAGRGTHPRDGYMAVGHGCTYSVDTNRNITESEQAPGQSGRNMLNPRHPVRLVLTQLV